MTDTLHDLIVLAGILLPVWLTHRLAKGDRKDRELASRTVRNKTREIQTMRRRHRRELQQRDATIRRLRRQMAAKESTR